jgi:hypothetical protein
MIAAVCGCALTFGVYLASQGPTPVATLKKMPFILTYINLLLC